MEFHEIIMQGPLHTDNIRAKDGTLAATIADSTGNVNFQRDIEARDIDARRNLDVFNNLTVQGPLASFLQSISVGTNAAITGNVTVGVDLDVGNDLTTLNFQMTGNSPGVNKVLISDASGNASWQNNTASGFASVPTGQSILFYTNDTVLGYTIVTTLNDDLVYVTKGSAAGGQTGGAAKPLSTWTQPTHRHGVSSITLPAHNHKWMDYVSKGVMYSWAADGVTQLNIRTAYGITGHTTNGFFVQVTSANSNNPAGDFWTQDSGALSLSGNSDYNGTVNTWRPKGANFTLQQRN